jgi:hypothetical protein
MRDALGKRKGAGLFAMCHVRAVVRLHGTVHKHTQTQKDVRLNVLLKYSKQK